jgi:hypothetical protein
MALQDVSNMYFPSYVGAGFGQNRSRTLDAADEYVSQIFAIPKTGTLKKIGFRTGTVTTADTINVRLETVDATTGYPSGTLYLNESPGSSGSQAAPSSNTTYWVALNGTTGVSVTKGDIVAIKILLDYVDGVLDIVAHTYIGTHAFPYVEDYYNSTHTKGAGEQGNFGLEYDGEIVLCNGTYPAVYMNVSSSWATNGYKKGLCFQVPFKCRISGVVYTTDADNDCEIILYDSDQATAVQTWSIDKDVRGATSGSIYKLYLTTPKTLTINTKYRLVVQPLGANITHHLIYTYPDSTISAMAGIEGGVNCYYTECNGTPENEASWTDTVENRPLAGIIIDQLDDGVSTGGSAPRFGDMTGGLK